METTKAERFQRLAEKRVSRAIRDLRLIANLSNKNNYEYTTDQVEKIVSALRRELRGLHRRFQDGTNPSKVEFRL